MVLMEWMATSAWMVAPNHKLLPQAGRALPTLNLKHAPQTLPGGVPAEEVDLTGDDVDEDKKLDEAAKKRKKLGLPEVDPDSLPSTNLPKFMTFGFHYSHPSCNSQCATLQFYDHLMTHRGRAWPREFPESKICTRSLPMLLP